MRQIIAIISVLAVLVLFQNCEEYKSQSITLTEENSPPNQIEAEEIDGVLVYNQQCMNCHGALVSSTKRNKSFALIDTAILNVPAMSGIKLKPEEIEAVALVLKDAPVVGGGESADFQCDPVTPPSNSKLVRLSNYEYRSSLERIFYRIKPEITQFMNSELRLPEEAKKEGFDNHVLNLSTDRLEGYYNAANGIGTLVGSSEVNREKVFGSSCVNASNVSDSCLETFLAEFGRKIFRRPLNDTEIASYINTFKMGSGLGNDESVKLLVQRLLLSPNFLFKVEVEGTAESNNLLKLSPYELASRLSFALTGASPDDMLLEDVAENGLNDERLLFHARRYFNSTRGQRHIERFFRQWLSLETISGLDSNDMFPGLSEDDAKNQLLDEMNKVVNNEVFTKNSSYKELMSTQQGYVASDFLKSIYKMSSSENGFVTLPQERKGLLTRAAFLFYGHDDSHPILRGVKILEDVLCVPMDSPPADAIAMRTPASHLLSTRQRFTEMTSPSACIGCHSKINPVGFAFENFNGLGMIRTQEQIIDNFGQVIATHNIDAQTTLELGDDTFSVNGGSEAGERIAVSDQAAACFSRKVFRGVMGKQETQNDSCAIGAMYNEASDSNKSVLSIFEQIILSDNFKSRAY